MSDLSFARKYRPNTLSGYIGNQSVKESALKALEAGKRRPQVVLLYGDSGCGKTTFARLLAKEYSCEDRKTEACGVCPSCQNFDEYIETGDVTILPNVHEVNIADTSGKHDLDSVLADIEIPVFADEWKIYIFDECHMATDQLQQKLLKIVEEPPRNVLFIFCTTNPEKMIPTLKNRCALQLHVQKPTIRELAGLLKMVCVTEGVDFDAPGLEFVAQRANLVIRQSLMNLEQVINEQGAVTYKNATKVFESISSVEIAKFVRALKSKNVLEYINALAKIKERMELSVFLVELKKFLINGVYVANSVKVEGITDNEIAMYRNIFADMGVNNLNLLLNRVLAVSPADAEYALITLGYTGMYDIPRPDDNPPPIDPVTTLKSEIMAEQGNAVTQLQEAHKEEQTANLATMGDMFSAVSMDDLLSAGGSILSDKI